MNTAARHLSHAATPRRGFTLVEAMIGVATVALVAGTVLPGFSAAIERRHLEGAAAQLATDLMLTRSLAVTQDRSMRMTFRSDGGGSCYVVHSGAASDCRCVTSGPAAGTSACSNGATAMRTVFYPATGTVGVQSNVNSMLFQHALGTITPTGTLRVTGRSGAAIHQVVNLMGRTRACSPAPALPGYRAC